jgi:hypothetical protein
MRKRGGVPGELRFCFHDAAFRNAGGLLPPRPGRKVLFIFHAIFPTD